MALYSSTKDGFQSLAPRGWRTVARAVGLFAFAPALIGTVVGGATSPVYGFVAVVLVFAGLTTAAAIRRSGQVHELASSNGRLLRLERAMSAASAALLKRGVADPVGTALLALVDGVEASWVFLDSVGDKEADQTGVVTTVRDVLRIGPAGEPAGWDLMPWRVTAATRSLLEADKECVVSSAELDDRSAALYRAAQIGSEIVLPISVEGVWVGNVGFSSRDEDRLWSEGERELLKVGAEMIGAYWERRDAVGRLEELVAAKDEFIASVSHEVRTPLTAVLGFAHELNEARHKFTEEELDDLLALLASQSQEVANIVDDLLIAARAETGSLVIVPEQLSVKSLVGEVLSSHSGRVDFAVAAADDLEVWADPVRARQVLRNLLTNADRYGGNMVLVDACARGDAVAIEVRDNGDGIPQRMRDHIFEPYARGHNGRGQPASVGLGLSVARKLAQLMKGDVVLDRENGWTVFTLTLPAASGIAAPRKVASRTRQPVSMP